MSNYNNKYSVTKSVAAAHNKVNSSLFTTSILAKPMIRAAPTAPRAQKNTVRMSHFTSLKTRIADRDMLKKSLEDMNVEFAVAKNEDLLTVRGHRGETTKAEFSIQQNNGYDFGFKFNGNEYELVAD